ncbi:MAG TPA: ABC transporter ATP-binding protein [Candidatus Paceibacterota bacterium]|nr:ABC transporter ATP-binding protein [Candidatus Paceibacterota bacterium]
MSTPLLSVENLAISTIQDPRILINDVTFEIREGEAVGVVGESGSGKTLTALSILGLLPRGVAVTQGSIKYNGIDLNAISAEEMRKIRGSDISMVYQDPMTALNPVMKLGKQLREVIESHEKVDSNTEQRVRDALMEVGIPDVARAMESYPHEFSGGMRQRVMIAMALILSPKLLIADEPTTALDVTIQQQILALVAEERRKRNMSMLWITHDLGVVANLVDRLIVMYAGRIVEAGTVKEIFTHPQHPYTYGLLSSLPTTADKERKRLTSIAGVPQKPWLVGQSCSFAPRCFKATPECRSTIPQLVGTLEKSVSCFHPIGAKI